jgi:hypothetical protein
MGGARGGRFLAGASRAKGYGQALTVAGSRASKLGKGVVRRMGRAAGKALNLAGTALVIHDILDDCLPMPDSSDVSADMAEIIGLLAANGDDKTAAVIAMQAAADKVDGYALLVLAVDGLDYVSYDEDKAARYAALLHLAKHDPKKYQANIASITAGDTLGKIAYGANQWLQWTLSQVGLAEETYTLDDVKADIKDTPAMMALGNFVIYLKEVCKNHGITDLDEVDDPIAIMRVATDKFTVMFNPDRSSLDLVESAFGYDQAMQVSSTMVNTIFRSVFRASLAKESKTATGIPDMTEYMKKLRADLKKSTKIVDPQARRELTQFLLDMAAYAKRDML